eukprot:366134-Chlamydomonas_euryale.AAC.17
MLLPRAYERRQLLRCMRCIAPQIKNFQEGTAAKPDAAGKPDQAAPAAAATAAAAPAAPGAAAAPVIKSAADLGLAAVEVIPHALQKVEKPADEMYTVRQCVFVQPCCMHAQCENVCIYSHARACMVRQCVRVQPWCMHARRGSACVCMCAFGVHVCIWCLWVCVCICVRALGACVHQVRSCMHVHASNCCMIACAGASRACLHACVRSGAWCAHVHVWRMARRVQSQCTHPTLSVGVHMCTYGAWLDVYNHRAPIPH